MLSSTRSSGKNADRPGLADTFGYLRPGDVLTMVSLDRLAARWKTSSASSPGSSARGVGFQSLHEKLDTTTPDGMFVFHVFAALAEFIRTTIMANANEGLAGARARDQRLGRPPAMTPEKIAYARQLLAEPDRTISSIAHLVGVSRSTLYKAMPELIPPQDVAARLAAQLARLPPIPGRCRRWSTMTSCSPAADAQARAWTAARGWPTPYQDSPAPRRPQLIADFSLEATGGPPLPRVQANPRVRDGSCGVFMRYRRIRSLGSCGRRADAAVLPRDWGPAGVLPAPRPMICSRTGRSRAPCGCRSAIAARPLTCPSARRTGSYRGQGGKRGRRCRLRVRDCTGSPGLQDSQFRR